MYILKICLKKRKNLFIFIDHSVFYNNSGIEYYEKDKIQIFYFHNDLVTI